MFLYKFHSSPLPQLNKHVFSAYCLPGTVPGSMESVIDSVSPRSYYGGWGDGDGDRDVHNNFKLLRCTVI